MVVTDNPVSIWHQDICSNHDDLYPNVVVENNTTGL